MLNIDTGSDSDTSTRDSLFVKERRARSEAARQLIREIIGMHARWEEKANRRQRKRRPADQLAHAQMLESLICNALHANLIAPGGQVAISLARGRLSRYAPAPYAPLRLLLEALAGTDLGFLNLTIGSRPERGPGRMTTFSPTPRLIAMSNGLSLSDFGRRAGGEPIVLKMANQRVAKGGEHELPDLFAAIMDTGALLGEAIDYDDTPLSRQLREEMHRINRALDDADIDVLDRSASLDTGDRWLRRVFNNAHLDFSHGGRLYGGYWMSMSEDERLRRIRIDGEPVAELDFKSMAPRLLYARVDHPFPADSDPYDIPGVPPSCRTGVKKVMASLLFSRGPFERWPHGTAKIFKGIDRQSFIERLLKHHAPIRDHLGTRIGFELQRTESDIMVAILLESIERGLTLLPIHDAVLCRRSEANHVQEIMLQVFRRMTGGEAAVSVALSSDP